LFSTLSVASKDEGTVTGWMRMTTLESQQQSLTAASSVHLK